MLVQVKKNGLRLIKQHHHAMISGWLAFAWQGLQKDPKKLPFELVLAVSLHDLAWNEVDKTVHFYEQTGAPHDFISYPEEEKVRFYQAGVDQVAAIHPYAGILNSLHYTTMLRNTDSPPVEEFLEHERRRQQQLREQLTISEEQEPLLQRQLAYVKLFDNISLYLCLTPPSAPSEFYPPWLRQPNFRTPTEEIFTIEWQDDDNVTISPYPFERPLKVHIPCYDLPETVYKDEESLHRAWEQVEETHWSVRLGPFQPDPSEPSTRRFYHFPE